MDDSLQLSHCARASNLEPQLAMAMATLVFIKADLMMALRLVIIDHHSQQISRRKTELRKKPFFLSKLKQELRTRLNWKSLTRFWNLIS